MGGFFFYEKGGIGINTLKGYCYWCNFTVCCLSDVFLCPVENKRGTKCSLPFRSTERLSPAWQKYLTFTLPCWKNCTGKVIQSRYKGISKHNHRAVSHILTKRETGDRSILEGQMICKDSTHLYFHPLFSFNPSFQLDLAPSLFSGSKQMRVAASSLR